MRRAAVIVACAAVLLTGCRSSAGTAAGTPAPAVPTPVATTPEHPGAGTTTPPAVPAQVDSDLTAVDGLLGELDDDATMADQAPPDRDS